MKSDIRRRRIISEFTSGFGSGSVTPLTALETPDLYFNNVYNDRVQAFWSPGADGYEVDIATDALFASIVDTYTGIATDTTFTGLNADTQYYIRVKASKTGYLDSAYASVTCFTFFNVIAAYLPAGLPYINPGTVVNDFASVTTGAIDFLKSILNTSGPTLTRVGANFTRDYTPVDLPYARVTDSGTTYADFASDISLGTGAFTIIIKGFNAASLGGAGQVFSDTVGGERVRIENNTGCYVRIGATFSTKMTWPIAYTVGTVVDLIIESDGSTVRSSITGGSTWSNAPTRPAAGTAFSFTRMFASNSGGNNCVFTFESLLFDTTQLNSTRRDRWFTWMKNTDFVNGGVDFTEPLKQLPATFITDPVNGYINDYTGGLLLKGHGYSLTKNVFSYGADEYSLGVQKHHATPDFSDATLFFGNTTLNKVRTGIDLGHYTDVDDIHHVPSYSVVSNQLYIHQFNRQYGANDGSNLFVRKFWNDFNMMDYITLPRNKEVSKQYLLSDNQYPQSAAIGTLSAVFTQRREPSGALPGRIQCSLSNDGLASFYDMFSIVNTNTANNWMYPHMVYNGTRSEVVIFFEHVLAGVSPVRCLGITAFKTTDFITYSNIEGTFSKNVKTGGALTLTELYTNGTVLDARSLTSTCMTHPYITDTGMVYTIVGDGSNTGYKLMYQTIGGAMNLKDIDFGADSVVLGTQTDTTGSFQFAYHRAPIVAIYDGGSTFRVIYSQVNGGNWTPTVTESTDGDNWTKLGTIANIDTTKQHTEFEVSQNMHFNNGEAHFACACCLSSTTSKPFIRNINALI